MSKMSELVLEIQEMAHDMGDDYGFDADTITTIARVLDVPVVLVQEALEMERDDEYDYDDSMDGDFDSAMASAGYGMDEDYGYACDDY